MSDFDGSSRSVSPVSQEPSAPSPAYEYPLPPSQENLAPYYPLPRPTTGIFLPTLHLASSSPTRTSSGGRSNNENQANLASTHEEVDSLTNPASLGLVNMASLPTIPESRQQPHSSAENQNQTSQVLSRTQTEPKTKRNRRNAKEDPLFGVSRQLTLWQGLRAVNGVRSDSRNIQTPGTANFCCPICGHQSKKPGNLQEHFEICVRRHGNPRGACWNDNIQYGNENDDFRERRLLHRRRDGQVLTGQERSDLAPLQNRRVERSEARLRELQKDKAHEDTKGDIDDRETEQTTEKRSESVDVRVEGANPRRPRGNEDGQQSMPQLVEVSETRMVEEGAEAEEAAEDESQPTKRRRRDPADDSSHTLESEQYFGPEYDESGWPMRYKKQRRH